MMNKTVHELKTNFVSCVLSETVEELPQLLREAEKAAWTYLEFLESITRYELAKREAKSLEKRMKWARFPFVKSLNEFVLKGQNALTAPQLSQLRELSWLEQQYNLILLGPPTHISQLGWDSRPFIKDSIFTLLQWVNLCNF